LGVRYVLEGSVRRGGNRLRITAQLIDTTTGTHLWADRFDGAVEDIFDLQDQVTTSVVGAITPSVERAEIDRALLKSTDSLAAYDHYMRGIASAYQWTREATTEALRQYYKAIELDPKFAMAYALAASCYTWQKLNGWVTDSVSEMAETSRLVEQATRLSQDDAQVLGWSGAALAAVVGQVDEAVALIDRALRLNPNLMDAWLSSGFARGVIGNWEVAIDHFARAMRLSPFDPMLFLMQFGVGNGHFQTGRYEEAAAWAAKSIGEYPKYAPAWRLAAASNGFLGRKDQAQKAVAGLLHSSIRHCAWQNSKTERYPIGGPATWPDWRRGCEKLACLSDEVIELLRCRSLALNVTRRCKSVVAIGSTADKLRRRASLAPHRLTHHVDWR
jgi:adenylate cyclase